MNYKEIKGIKHFIYTIEEWESKYPESTLVSWRIGQEGNWVLTDDNHVVQILKRAKYNNTEIVRCITGTFNVNRDIRMGSAIPDNIYSFSKYKVVENFKNREKLTNNEFLFAQYVANTQDAVSSYLKAYKTNNKDYARKRSSELLRSERVRKMVSKEIQDIMESEGVSKHYMIQVFKQIADLAERDNDKLRAVENLAKIAGLYETEKKSEQLTVFAGFTDEQMKAISNGKQKPILTAKKNS
tara:strand:- start:574 stop:1296 length:723 start_codon:yes stop_codon:yes gene_type:complete